MATPTVDLYLMFSGQNVSIFRTPETGTPIFMFYRRFAFWKMIVLFWVKFMFKRIVRTSRVQFKVFYPVVGFISIYMMDVFIALERSIKKPFHNKPVLGFVLIRGISFFYISLRRMGDPSFPGGTFLSSIAFLKSSASKDVFSFIPCLVSLFEFSIYRCSLPFFEGSLGYYSSFLSFVPRDKTFSERHIFNYNVTGDTIQ